MSRRPSKTLITLAFVAGCFALGALGVYLHGTDGTPWPVREAGGRILRWDDAMKAEWASVAACVQRPAPPDTTLTIYELPPGSPAFLRDAETLEFYRGWYFKRSHAAVLPWLEDPALRRTSLRHEFVHALLRTEDHPALFHTFAEACDLGDKELFR